MRIPISIFLLFASSLLQAQRFDELLPLTDDLIEAMVDSAMDKHPSLEVLKAKVRQTELQVSTTQQAWMDDIKMGVQYNSVQNQQTEQYNLVPQAGLGLSISLGSVTNRGLKTKMAREDRHAAKARLESQKRWLRSEIIQRLYQFRTFFQLYQLYKENRQNAEMKHAFVKEQFEAGAVPFSTYSESKGELINQKQRLIEAENTMKAKKAHLEQLVGDLSTYQTP